ncbi:FMN-dependent NADH-azoreductase [Streptomyces rectiviolaceus]|uniref:FMN-dependent NADH-azoreductase n=1 Tax=Streptomyces rectiviolaceus TaxID=332591 RepID=UPI0036447E9D
MSLFRLDASILPGTSASAELADLVESEWTAVHPDVPVVRRHLGTDPLPADAWAHAHTGNLTPELDRTPAQRDALTLAGSLTAELKAAEAVVLAVPLYNFGVSQHFKTWVDLIIAGSPLGSPVLKDKPTFLATVRGGGYAPALRAKAGTTPPPTSSASSPTCGRPTSLSSNASSPSPRPPPAWNICGTSPPSCIPKPWPRPATPAVKPQPSDAARIGALCIRRANDG